MDLDKEQMMLELLKAAIRFRMEDLLKQPGEEEYGLSEYPEGHSAGYDIAVDTVLKIMDDNSPGEFIRNYTNGKFGIEGDKS